MYKGLFFISILFLFLTGCTRTNNYVQSDSIIKDNAKKHKVEDIQRVSKPIITPEEYKKMLKDTSIKEAKPKNTNEALMSFYKEWKNVKYKYGGNSKKGIDCSAFTQRIYKEIFNINIPRTTTTQVKVGKKISKKELEQGDLVFFKTGKFDRHVGIYMGNGDFMHASIKGIKFTKINKPFYKRNYWTSRRIDN